MKCFKFIILCLLIGALSCTNRAYEKTPYETYQNTLLTKYGISVSFPEEVAEHYPQFNNPETQPSIVFNELDTTTGFTFYTFDAVVKLSPDVCILISNIVDLKSSFKEHEFYINYSKITLDNIRPRFSSQLFYNCNLPWEWWLDYEGEEKRLRDECCANYIQRSTTSKWIKESNAELGYITRFPHYEKIGYRRTHEELFESTPIGAPYNACYGVELIRLYNPASIRMLVFINTDKEKDVMKCIERICSYVTFDNSQVEELNEAQQTTTKVTIADNVASIFNYRENKEFSLNTEITRGELLDTLNLYSPIKPLKGVVQKADNVSLKLSADHYDAFIDSTYTRYRLTYKAHLNDATCLSTELYMEETEINGNPYQGEYGRIKFFAKGDTIYSVTIPDPTDGFSSEGLTFQISGEDVTNVTATYTMHYTAITSEKNSRLYDGKCTAICDFVTEEHPLSVDDFSYTLPIVKELEMTATDWQRMEELRPEAIKRWEARTGATMDTTDLVYRFELEHFLINLSVIYADGSVRNYQHVALSEYDEP